MAGGRSDPDPRAQGFGSSAGEGHSLDWDREINERESGEATSGADERGICRIGEAARVVVSRDHKTGRVKFASATEAELAGIVVSAAFLEC
jgi:hypothetical protein